jgi:acetylornithine deacetylase/succinyl-diaminopimelate desuccinylase-like protein
VNGLTAGYQGHGAKTVIGAKASAKISFRLVPRQDPRKVQEQFRAAMRERCPSNVKIEFANHGLAPAAIVPIDNPATKLAAEALERGFGKPPALIRTGGTIPVVGLIKQTLGIDTVLVGFGLPDDRVHSPNEKFDLDCFYKGQRTAAALYDKLADQPRAAQPARQLIARRRPPRRRRARCRRDRSRRRSGTLLATRRRRSGSPCTRR